MKQFLKPLYIASLFTLIAVSALAQNGTIRGFVYDKNSGEPVIFTNVVLKGKGMGASTDVNGYFSISKIPAGSYTIQVSYLGYDTLEKAITITGNQILTEKLYLVESSVDLGEFVVSADQQEALSEVKMSVVKITPKEIKSLPTVGGEADLAQYLQVLPGVIFTGDQGGQLYIRGGSPIQNKVLLDGMVIYNPFHSIGLFSVFDTDIIRNADVYTGGFNAQYGGRISSIMDITTRDGNRKKFGGKVGASPFGAKLLLEGPLGKSQDAGGSAVSYIVSAKTSYLQQTSKLLYRYINEDGLPFNFTDLYGKLSFNSNNGSKFNVFGFNYTDRVNYEGVSNLNWNTYGVGSNFILIPQGSPVLIEGAFSFSDYGITLSEQQENGSSTERFSNISGFNLGLDFTYFIRDDEVKYGIEVLGFATDFTYLNALNRSISQQENTTELAGYVKYKYNRGKLVLEPSFRLHYYASLSNISPEPRLGAKFNATKSLRFKFATGLYSQNLISAVSDRDVVNLFSGFLSGPDNLQRYFLEQTGNVREVSHKLQKATHAILGFEWDVTRRISLNIEGYYKHFNQLTNINRNKIFDDTPENSDVPDVYKKDFIIETGDAYGVDFVAKYDYKRLYIWAVYSLGKVTRWDGVNTDLNGELAPYAPVFDRRHNVNLVGSYAFGKAQNWEFNARWNLGSGFPFTQTQGYFQNQTFADGINTDYIANNGDMGILYGNLNLGRLPYYHRLDLNLKYKIYLLNDSEIEINAGVTNLYNRANVFYFDRVKYERVNQLPIMPSLGFSWNF